MLFETNRSTNGVVGPTAGTVPFMSRNLAKILKEGGVKVKGVGRKSGGNLFPAVFLC